MRCKLFIISNPIVSRIISFVNLEPVFLHFFVSVCLFVCLFSFFYYFLPLTSMVPSSETRGQIVGAGKSLNGREKIRGKKVKKRFLTFFARIFFSPVLDVSPFS